MNKQELRTNKQELISKYELIKNSFNFKVVATDGIISDLKRLDEPEKVKVSEAEEKFLKTFDFNCENDVTKALYNVSRVGWGYYLTDNNDIELKDLTEGFRNLENRKRLIKAILDGYEVEKTKYVVTDGNHLYFKGYQEDVDIVILVDEQPGTMEYVKKFNTKEEAQKAADILGWKVQEVE